MKQFFSDIYLILMIDCEGSAKLTSDSLDRRLRWAERVAAFMHRLICEKSRRLHRQVVQMNATIKDSVDMTMTPDAQERIRKALADRRGKH